ncbi:MAG: Ig-like domain-containing protein [Candidatus Coatesbacteria bacterium]|nr:Ig-like domain-containing protein [Candidatus Coatesbacteria bacterium]
MEEPIKPTAIGWIFRVAIIAGIAILAAGCSPDVFAADGGATMPTILLVDDGNSEYYTYGASYFTEALDARGFTYDIYNIQESSLIPPSVSKLRNYDVVIWTTGDEFFHLQDIDEINVKYYLDSGGAIYISSEWLTYNNYSSELMEDYLQISYDYWSYVPLILGEHLDPITSGMVIAPEHPPSFYWEACYVKLMGDVPQKIFGGTASSHTSCMGIRAPSDEVDLDYRVILTNFPFEAIVDEQGSSEPRAEFLYRVITWLYDRIAPSLEWSYPSAGCQSGYTNGAVILELADIGTGVDKDSIELLIDEEAVTPDVAAFSGGLRVRYDFPEPRGPGSVVQVQVSCQDRYKSPNQMEPLIYSYSIGNQADLDNEPPYPTEFGPSGALAAEDNNSYKIHATIRDDGTGVDRAGLRIKVDGKELGTLTERTEGGIELWCVCPSEFRPYREHFIEVTAQDLASPPNEMEPLQFSFEIPEDTSPPMVTDVTPTDGSVWDMDEFYGARNGGRIEVRMKDYMGGIDPYSVRMQVNGKLVRPSSAPFFDGLKIRYYADEDEFAAGEEVNVELYAEDTAIPPIPVGPISWSFSLIGEDRTPPSVTGTIPEPDSVGIPRNTHVFIMVSPDTDPASVTQDLLTVEYKRVGGGVLEGTTSFDPDTPYIHFVPFNNPPARATITVRMEAGLRDMSGNVMEEPYEFSYRVGSGFDLDAPAPASNVFGYEGDGEVSLYWQTSDDEDAIFYRIYYDSDGCCEPYEGDDLDQGPSPIDVYDMFLIHLTGLDNAKTYHFAVTAMDCCSGESDYSDEFVASSSSIIDAPKLMSAGPGNGFIHARWEHAENISLAGYRLHYEALGRAKASSGDDDSGWVDAGMSTEYKIYGLSEGRLYRVWVTGYNQRGEDGLPSESLTISPSAETDWLDLQLPGPAPGSRYDHQLVFVSPQRKIYLIGGTTEMQTDTLYALDLDLFRWETVPTTGPYPPPGRCFSFYDSDRYVIWVVASNVTVYRLDLLDYEWTAFEPAGTPPPVSFGKTTPTLPSTGFLDSLRNRLLFYGCLAAVRGGATGIDYERQSDVYFFDLDAHEWATHVYFSGYQPLSFHQAAFAYVPYIDRAYLFGGLGENGVSSKSYMFDPEELVWVSLPTSGSLPMERFQHAMVIDENLNRLVVFGGRILDRELSWPVPSNELYSFSLFTNEWTDLAATVTGYSPSPRRSMPMVVVPSGIINDSSAYLITHGGYGDDGPFGDAHCLKLYDYFADRIPPAGIEDLSAALSNDGAQVQLSWTAPGDDGHQGRASGYDIRISSSPIENDEDFDGAPSVPVLYLPSFPGTLENLQLTLAQTDETSYFSIKTIDEAGNVSIISNCANTSPPHLEPLALIRMRDSNSVGHREYRANLKPEARR